MLFEATAQFVNAEADANPGTNPADIFQKHVLSTSRRQADSDVLGKRLLLVLEAPVAETLTLDLWAIDDATDQDGQNDAPSGPSTRRWYRFATAVVVTGTRITEVTAACPAGGKIYAQRTADALTVPRILKASCVP